MNGENRRRLDKQRYCSEILLRIVPQIAAETHRYWENCSNQQKGIAVGRGSRNQLRTDPAARPAAIFYNELRSQAFTDARGKQTGGGGGAPARRIGHDQANRRDGGTLCV